jgi:hypothetical protein
MAHNATYSRKDVPHNANHNTVHKLSHGPSAHGCNAAPDITPHLNGLWHIPSAITPSSQQTLIGCHIREFDAQIAYRQACKAERRQENEKLKKQQTVLTTISLKGSKPMAMEAILGPINFKTKFVYSVKKDLNIITPSQINDCTKGLKFQCPDSKSTDIILCPQK